VQEVRSLDEAEACLHTAKGGGGTSFIPVFDEIEAMDLQPQAVIYLTDMIGSFPKSAPYPVIWCSTSKGIKPPFGDLVEITT